ncbi:hypothetical protein M0802_011307 [Mischocyttarus mexicanus]|nr:hypothetical protein M0802_011307 [Mischocyttarus mexicanus]
MFFHNASNLITSFLDIQWNQHLREEIGSTNINNSEWKGVNTTKHHFPSKIWIIRPTWETTLKILSILPIIFVGILANGALIYIIIRAKSLHTTTNLLIVNMAIADICTCILCPWMFLCIDLYQNYILGPVGCRLDGFIVHALTLVAVFNLSVVSYDRLSAIVLNCSSRLTKSYYERQWSDFLETYCTEDTVVLYPYWHVFAGLTVWAPLTIMAICYSSILIKLDRFESQALRSKYPIIVRYKGKVARALGIIVLAFILCRVPFTVLIIQRARFLQQPSKPGQAESMYFLWYISRYLVFVNAAINPLLYGCSSSSLRKELAICPATSWLIHKRKKKIQKPHSNQQCNSEPFNCLKPRSPCIRVNYYQRSIIPNISSRVSPINLDLSPN